MITVLWVMTVASVVATAGAVAGRNVVNATRNRTELERAHWNAEGCASVARAEVDDALGSAITYDDAAARWRVLPRFVPPSTCRINLTAAGTRLDINAASGAMLDSAFELMGHTPDDANSIATSIVSWIGANGPFASTRELAQIGVAYDSGLDSVLWAEPGRVSLATASVSVLALVPGITRETAGDVVALRDAGSPVTDILNVLGDVSHASADAAMAHYSDIVRFTTPDPEAWILTVSATSGYPTNTATVEWRLVRAGKRCVIARSRTID